MSMKMMYRVVLVGFVFVCMILQGQGLRQASVKIIYPIRIEETIATHEKSNEPFFRDNENIGVLNHTISLVMDGVQKGQLAPLYISDESHTVKTMTYDEWLGRIQRNTIELKPWRPTTSYKVDMDGFVSNQCVFKGKTYVCLKNSKGKRPDMYIGTYWGLLSDNLMTACEFGLIQLDITKGETPDGKEVEQVNYLTFYDDDKMSINGLLTSRFSIKWLAFIDFLDKYHSDKLYYKPARRLWFDTDIFITSNAYWLDQNKKSPFSFLPEVPLYMKNEASGKSFVSDDLITKYAEGCQGLIDTRNDTIKINVKRDQNQKAETYSLPLQEYLKVMNDSNYHTIAYTLADAWRMKLFEYDESMKLVYAGDVDAMRKDLTISKNGYFLKSKKPDPLCGTKIAPSFVSSPIHKPVIFTLTELWGISLIDTSNKMLVSGTMSLQDLLVSYVREGKIKVQSSYDTALCEKTSIYNTECLYWLRLYSVRTFSIPAHKSSSELQHIELSLPANEAIKGIQEPIFRLNWKPVRTLLKSDPRAIVEYEGKKINYADLLEKRVYEGWLLKTGFLRALK